MQNVTHSPVTRGSAEDTGQIPVVMFGGSAPPGPPEPAPTPTGPDYPAIQASPEFRALRSRFRRFVFPMSLAFFVWYMTYVLLAAYAHDFMSIAVYGEVNIGIVLGVLQFVSTIAIMIVYVRFADRRIDPRVADIRRQAGVSEA
ncbi:hypothetical protein CFN78_05475 [Amycolatopsis antarctica]|uniref:Clumping factor B n=1 Tax=Amycolatopsis antarctica TaxID=1854586 RepID=A0A263D846_9PSEU|nr:DUF485 domain-containing protein [Amycolatopsis antarctica]OZM74561.1 hypothetical protein CFN78_05475 [Amycolatopsis antarctica]